MKNYELCDEEGSTLMHYRTDSNPTAGDLLRTRRGGTYEVVRRILYSEHDQPGLQYTEVEYSATLVVRFVR